MKLCPGIEIPANPDYETKNPKHNNDFIKQLANEWREYNKKYEKKLKRLNADKFVEMQPPCFEGFMNYLSDKYANEKEDFKFSDKFGTFRKSEDSDKDNNEKKDKSFSSRFDEKFPIVGTINGESKRKYYIQFCLDEIANAVAKVLEEVRLEEKEITVPLEDDGYNDAVKDLEDKIKVIKKKYVK